MQYLLAVAMVVGLSGGAMAQDSIGVVPCGRDDDGVVRTCAVSTDGVLCKMPKNFPADHICQPGVMPTCMRTEDVGVLACPASPIHEFKSSTTQWWSGSWKDDRRSYTLDEIDRMRATTMLIMLQEGYFRTPGMGHDVMRNMAIIPAMLSSGDYKNIEDRLRTYIAAGIRPEELEAKVK